ncbi:multidrug effflux MFS transporter [Flexibacterium corallicola]|uniref:multidrug effflux MFS transporter n=1 Tax=Flexibacterium corallicola TaxID=3037259 RepID=UPI00286EDD89|nr:multidrug effflux MFS transporter [Pseudovibrio sp. M1P-2-3]
MSSSLFKYENTPPHNGIGFREFIGLVAAFMALSALSTDIILPALPLIGKEFAVHDSNNRQFLITVYLTSLSVASLVFGPLSDWLGRKRVLLFGVALFTVGTVYAATAETFETMLVARLIQGVGAASPRVVSISMVRDWYAGRAMGRVVSLAMAVIMISPIIAPSIGQGILLIGPWNWTFFLLTGVGALIFLWSAVRLPESLPKEKRRAIGLSLVLTAYKSTLTIRFTFGYMLATSLIMGCMFGFLNSAQQIFMNVFDLKDSFLLIIGLIALAPVSSSLLNSQVVERWGLRKLSHIAILCFTLANTINAAIGYTDHETLWSFIFFQFIAVFFVGFIGANWNALAMDPLGQTAGTGSAMFSAFTTMIGALLGAGIGHYFDGSTLPYTVSCAVFGLMAILVVFITEKGQLFKPHNEA